MAIFRNPFSKSGYVPYKSFEHEDTYNTDVYPELQGEPPVIRFENISKSFGPVMANRNISLDIRSGKILALLGENGAGKSTLMSILAGRLTPDSGRIIVAGEPMRFASAADAIEVGVGMVYQHFMLVDSMSVAANVMLGQEESFLVRPGAMERSVSLTARRYGLRIDPSARISSLSMGERQRVEILKLLQRKSTVLIFDEPTAVLTPPEIRHLFKALRSMAALGKAIVFISHKLEEVMELADDIVVLRHGEVVDRMKAKEVESRAELARSMVGRDVLLEVDRPEVARGETVMRARGLGRDHLHGVDFELARGEVLAVVGVAGNGQKPLVETVTGLARPARGSLEILGHPSRAFFSRREARNRLAYIPEDRVGLATCPDLDMTDNFLLTTRHGFSLGQILKRRQARQALTGLIRDFSVTPPWPETRVGRLSGGNLQKLVLAREFFRKPDVIIAEQPSQGLDVSATEEVWDRLVQARAHAGILLVTGDLTEALQLADRIAVIHGGRFMEILDADDARAVDRIGMLMAGMDSEAAAREQDNVSYARFRGA
jgi:simple sugar transport system ATP-binding protein